MNKCGNDYISNFKDLNKNAYLIDLQQDSQEVVQHRTSVGTANQLHMALNQ